MPSSTGRPTVAQALLATGPRADRCGGGARGPRSRAAHHGPRHAAGRGRLSGSGSALPTRRLRKIMARGRSVVTEATAAALMAEVLAEPPTAGRPPCCVLELAGRKRPGTIPWSRSWPPARLRHLHLGLDRQPKGDGRAGRHAQQPAEQDPRSRPDARRTSSPRRRVRASTSRSGSCWPACSAAPGSRSCPTPSPTIPPLCSSMCAPPASPSWRACRR